MAITRFGRVQLGIVGMSEMYHATIREAYPRIMESFDDGFAEVLDVQIDGTGEYIALVTCAGINVIYTQDSQGFEDLTTLSDSELEELRERIEESVAEQESEFGESDWL